MKRMDRLQKLLYLLMAVLGIYIAVKGGSMLLKKQAPMESGTIQRIAEDAALRTYVPGYTAVVEGRQTGGLLSRLMRPVLPVYSYLAEKDTNKGAGKETDKGTGKETEKETSNRESEQETGLTESGETLTEAVSAEAASQISAEPQASVLSPLQEQAQRMDFSALLSAYYSVDGGTTIDASLLDAETLLHTDLTLEQNPDVPQILIYHTHSQEAFADSEEGNSEHTVVGMGSVLQQELERFGYQVLHDTGVYDLVDGVLDRSAAYDYAREAVLQILEENPSIEVIIDLHRDGVEGKKFVTEVEGKPTSMVMFFNGLSRNQENEPLYWLENPYIKENLAFSLQLQLRAREQYPGFTRNIYLKAERFNLHLRPRSLLIEAGTQMNTVEEEQNAMRPLADLIHQVLSGNG